MTAPLRINCESASMIPPIEEIRAMADPSHHVVLQFPAAQQVDKPALIGKLAAALPEHSVFDSGGDTKTDWVTVMPVVARDKVLARTREIKEAVTMYIEACSVMLAKHEEGGLSAEWSSSIHGEHKRFENSNSGQVIEAPLSGAPEPSRVDPCFFSWFVKSTPGLELVAQLLKHEFHDAARILDVLFREPGSDQPNTAPNGSPAPPLGNSGVAEGLPLVN